MPLLYFPSSRDREHGDVVLKPDWFSLQLLSMFSPVNYYHFSLLTASGNLRYISYFFFETFWVLTFMKFSLGRCSLSAPSYQMIILETDLKWLPLLTDFPESFSHSRRYIVKYTITIHRRSVFPHYQVLSKLSFYLLPFDEHFYAHAIFFKN